MTISDKNISIARATFQAFIDKDRDAMEAIIADNFHFTSPLDNRIDRKTFFERCWPNSEWLTAFDFVNLVPDGDRVFVTYEATGNKGNRFRNTEILTFREDKLINVEVYFGWGIPHKAKPGDFIDAEDS